MRIDQMHYNFELELDRVAANDRPDFMPWEIDEYLNKAIYKFVKTRYSSVNTVKQGFETSQKRIDELANLHIKSPELQPAVIPIDLTNGVYEVRMNSLGNNISGQYFRYLFLTDAVIKARKGSCTKDIGHSMYQIDDRTTLYDFSSWRWCRAKANMGRSTFVTPPVIGGVVADSMDFTANLITGAGAAERFNNDELESLFIDTKNSAGVIEFTVDTVCVSYIKAPNRVFIGGYNHIDKHSTNSTDPIHCDVAEPFHDEIVRLAVKMAQEDVQDKIGIQVSNKKTMEDQQI